MIKIKNAEFTAHNIGITIPENFRVDITPEKFGVEGTLAVQHITNEYYASYETIYDGMDLREELLSCNYNPEDIKEIEHNGLKCCYVVSKKNCEHVYEARFLIEETDEDVVQLIFMVTDLNKNIDKIMESEDFKKLLNGIRLKEE